MNSRYPLVTVPHVGLAVVCVALVSWQSVRLARENRAARVSMAELRGRAAEVSLRPLMESAEVAAARVEVERELAALRAAEAKADGLAQSLSIAPGEELKSLGRTEQLADEGVRFLKVLNELPKLKEAAEAKGDSAALDPIIEQLVSWSLKMDAIGNLEDQPEIIGQIHATALHGTLDLDKAVTERVRAALVVEFVSLHNQGLDRTERPTEDQDAWYARRDEALASAAARIEALIPASQRKPDVVAQVMHLGSGMRTRVSHNATGQGSVTLWFKAPGVESALF
jgi:hypothetical protein